MFFDEQTPDSLAAAIRRFENGELNLSLDDMRLNDERFSCERFQHAMRRYVDERWSEFRNNLSRPGEPGPA